MNPLHVIGLDLEKLAVRFWPKVDRREPDECWPWQAYRDLNGYGRFYVHGRMQSAHVVTYWLAHRRDVPAGLEIDHLCRNRACVNPAHLEPVTHAENSRRSTAGEVNRARRIAITHCPKNHPYDAENTSFRPNGSRRCKTCEREAARQRYAADPAHGQEIARRYRARKKGVS